MDKPGLKQEIRKQTLGYILTALGLVAGLAWNEAIKNLIERLWPKGEGGSLTAEFVYAIIITVIVVIVATYLTRYIHKED